MASLLEFALLQTLFSVCRALFRGGSSNSKNHGILEASETAKALPDVIRVGKSAKQVCDEGLSSSSSSALQFNSVEEALSEIGVEKHFRGGEVGSSVMKISLKNSAPGIQSPHVSSNSIQSDGRISLYYNPLYQHSLSIKKDGGWSAVKLQDKEESLTQEMKTGQARSSLCPHSSLCFALQSFSPGSDMKGGNRDCRIIRRYNLKSGSQVDYCTSVSHIASHDLEINKSGSSQTMLAKSPEKIGSEKISKHFSKYESTKSGLVPLDLHGVADDKVGSSAMQISFKNSATQLSPLLSPNSIQSDGRVLIYLLYSNPLYKPKKSIQRERTWPSLELQGKVESLTKEMTTGQARSSICPCSGLSFARQSLSLGSDMKGRNRDCRVIHRVNLKSGSQVDCFSSDSHFASPDLVIEKSGMPQTIVAKSPENYKPEKTSMDFSECESKEKGLVPLVLHGVVDSMAIEMGPSSSKWDKTDAIGQTRIQGDSSYKDSGPCLSLTCLLPCLDMTGGHAESRILHRTNLKLGNQNNCCYGDSDIAVSQMEPGKSVLQFNDFHSHTMSSKATEKIRDENIFKLSSDHKPTKSSSSTISLEEEVAFGVTKIGFLSSKLDKTDVTVQRDSKCADAGLCLALESCLLGLRIKAGSREGRILNQVNLISRSKPSSLVCENEGSKPSAQASLSDYEKEKHIHSVNSRILSPEKTVCMPSSLQHERQNVKDKLVNASMPTTHSSASKALSAHNKFMPTKSEGQATTKIKWQLNEEVHFPYVTNSKVGNLSSFICSNEEAPIRGRPTVKEIVSKFNSLSRDNTPSMLSERDRKVKYYENDSVGFKFRKGYRDTQISETESQKPTERSRKTVKKIVLDWESLSFRRVTSCEQSILKEINLNLPLQQVPSKDCYKAVPKTVSVKDFKTQKSPC